MLTVRRNWKEIKSDLQKEWKMISDEDWKNAQGDEQKLMKMLQQKTDLAEDIIESKVSEIFGCHSTYDEKSFRNRPYIKVNKGAVNIDWR